MKAQLSIALVAAGAFALPTIVTAPSGPRLNGPAIEPAIGPATEPAIEPGSQGRRGVPNWELEAEFAEDAFTFVRIQYQSYGRRWHRYGDWATDWPDSDLNFSFRLQQLTSLKVDPDGLVLQLTDESLFDYPFIYLIEPGEMLISEEEIRALRRYCLNGGFLMVDDFWGDSDEYENIYGCELKRVFPDRDPLGGSAIEHEIFSYACTT